ncbi:MAG: glutamate--cysteine ligase [Leptospira sp.]|nr:glutamate--cysteine ligase [Leptospira sp.]
MKLLAKNYKQTAKSLLTKDRVNCLLSAKHGLEREALRIDSKGMLSKNDHPQSLGSSLTHPFIKTDFAEPQIEYATNPHKNMEDTLNELLNLHSFTFKKLEGETLWPFSMPSPLPIEEKIPVGKYGTSKEGRKKTIYRKGLGHRYGKNMQTISGVHYNMSFDKCLLSTVSEIRYKKPLEKFSQSEIYFDTIRNFNRISPVLMYLFGASSIIDESFIENHSGLKGYGKKTLNAPYATTLRLSNIGYTSKVQAKVPISVNSLKEYSYSMCAAVSKPYSEYKKYNLKAEEQLNDHYLQIENEYYSLVRPKQVPEGEERVIDALTERGVEYLEIRLLDVNPFSPIGVDETQLRFVHLFLIYCLLAESPKADKVEMSIWRKNQEKMTWLGRNSRTKMTVFGKDWSVSDLVHQILVELQPIADLLDGNDAENGKYTKAWDAQWEKWNDPSLLGSTQSEIDLMINKMSFHEFGLNLSKSHSKYLKDLQLSPKIMSYYESLATKSLLDQKTLESNEGSNIKKNQKPIILDPIKLCAEQVS